MACRILNFWDPLQHLEGKVSQRGHKQTPWMDTWQNPSSVEETQKRSRVNDGDLCLQIASSETQLLNIHQKLPDTTALFDLIKACGMHKDLRAGSTLHIAIRERGLLTQSISLGNALLSMYAKCGALAKAQEVFYELPARNVVTWNALIAAYTQHGFGDEALSCFAHMQDEGLSPNAVTFVCLLKACISIGATQKGEEIYAEVGRQGLLEKDIVVGTTLVDMYAKWGALAKAQAVLDKLPARNVATWTALIAGYAQHGLGDEALCCYERMLDEGLSPNAVTFICILKACGSMGAVEMGEEIHAKVSRQGLLEKDIVLATALVDMYAKCGALAQAQAVFDKVPKRDVVTWNALIAGYAQHGLGDEALSCFEQMREQGLSPDTVTFICILKACGSIGAAEKGEEIHAEVDRQGLLVKDIVLGTTLVDMYAKCGALGRAQGVFDMLPDRNLVTWNTLITGYAQEGLSDEALKCYEQMREQGPSPDAVTFVCILRACGSLGAAEKGKELHAEVSRQGLLEKDIVVCNALVDMYAKCGALAKAQGVFDMLPAQTVVGWNALMAGYAQAGKIKTVFDSFIQMVEDGIEPDAVTFVVLLTACSHAGLVEEGLMYFNTMNTVYHIIPNLEHRTCMVDILSRAGHFDKAINVIEKVPPSDCLLLWSVLMGACRRWANVELGRWAFKHAIQLDEKFDATYVSMSNIYADAGRQEEANRVETLRLKNGASKIPGRCWWTDVSRNVHSFTLGDKSHPQSKCIYRKLDNICQKLWLEGYSSHVPEAISDDEKRAVHCEMLAIACALINTPESTPIRFTKNTRVCGECHIATSLISKMEKRKIQATDANHIHIFEDGKCSCQDCW